MKNLYRYIGRYNCLRDVDIVLLEERKLKVVLFELFRKKFNLLDNLKCEKGECKIDVFDIPEYIEFQNLKFLKKRLL